MQNLHIYSKQNILAALLYSMQKQLRLIHQHCLVYGSVEDRLQNIAEMHLNHFTIVCRPLPGIVPRAQALRWQLDQHYACQRQDAAQLESYYLRRQGACPNRDAWVF